MFKIAFISQFNSYIMTRTITRLDLIYTIVGSYGEVEFKHDEDIIRERVKNLPDEDFDAFFFEQQVML